MIIIVIIIIIIIIVIVVVVTYFLLFPPPLSGHFPAADFELHEVEVKYGLLQLAEALSFLHTDVKMIHGNLTPFNVYINKDGAWKVAGRSRDHDQYHSFTYSFK